MKEKQRIFRIGLLIFLLLSLLFSRQAFHFKDSQHYLAEQKQAEKKEKPSQKKPSLKQWAQDKGIERTDLIMDQLEHKKIEEIVAHYQQEQNIADECFSISYHNLQSAERFSHRQDEKITAASTTKIMVAMLYLDLIQANHLNLDSKIPYQPSYYQDGNGEITAQAAQGQIQTSCSLKDLMEEMIIHSDNTATLMLRENYRLQYGDLEQAFQELLKLDESQYSKEEIWYNKCTSHILEEALDLCLKEAKYQLLLDWMKDSEQDFYMSTYLNQPMHAKYGSLDENQHDAGIFFYKQHPQYILVFMTQNLSADQADEFMGGINFQLALQAAYKEDLKNNT